MAFVDAKVSSTVPLIGVFVISSSVKQLSPSCCLRCKSRLRKLQIPPFSGIIRTRFTPQVLIADNTLITIFARSETCKPAALDITRRMSRAENGLATRPIVTVEEILLNDS